MITTYLEFNTIYASSGKISELNAEQVGFFKQSACLFASNSFSCTWKESVWACGFGCTLSVHNREKRNKGIRTG